MRVREDDGMRARAAGAKLKEFGATMYVDSRSATDVDGPAKARHRRTRDEGERGTNATAACFAAVVAYVWQEQSEYSFPQIQFAVFIFGIGVWSRACVSSCAARAASDRLKP